MLLSPKLRRLVGAENTLDAVSHKLRSYAVNVRAPVIGAFQISCSDESERECVESFHRIFVHELLPSLTFWNRSSFRTANLGARYEEGAIAIAEDHFATPESMNGFKLLVVKMNSHVSVVDTGEVPRYGRMQRYDRDSVYCGAVHATLDGGSLPFIAEMTRFFASGGLDRLAVLREMDPNTRSLAAAMTAVQLQAGRIVQDIARVQQRSPTLYLVVAGVTLNRMRADTEIICSLTAADYRGDAVHQIPGSQARATRKVAKGGESGVPVIEHLGIGDDPTRYRIGYDRGQITVSVE